MIAGGFAGIGTGATLVLLALTGALTPQTLPGLPVPSAVVAWALPAAKVIGDLAAVGTVGALLAAAVLAPGHRRMSVAGYRWTRLASWSACAWWLSAVLVLPLQLADFLGTGLPTVTIRGLASFATTIPQGQGQLLVVITTSALVLGARNVVTTGGSAGLLVLGVGAALPPAFTGHAAGSGSHQAAVSGLLLHVIGVLLWAGAVLALTLVRKLPVEDLVLAIRRFSAAAPALVALVALSGIITAASRLTSPGDLITTSYGLQVLAKTALLVMAAAIGALYRKWALPALSGGSLNSFRRLAAVEVTVFALSVGTAVSLSRTRTPQATDEPAVAEGTALDLLGFQPPPIPVGGRWWSQLWEPYPDPLFPVLLAAAAAGYLVAARAVVRAGTPWPARRTATAMTGLLLLLLGTSSGLARYASVTLTAHTVQYALIGLLAPLLLVLGARGLLPLALPAREPVRDVRGARGWWEAAAVHPVTRRMRQPGPALAAAGVVFYGGATGPVLDLVLRSHAAHLVSVLVTAAAGALLITSWLCPASPGTHTAWWILAWAFVHTTASTLWLLWPHVLAQSWWAEVAPTWMAGAAAADQRTAATISLAVGLVLAAAALTITRTHDARARLLARERAAVSYHHTSPGP